MRFREGSSPRTPRLFIQRGRQARGLGFRSVQVEVRRAQLLVLLESIGRLSPAAARRKKALRGVAAAWVLASSAEMNALCRTSDMLSPYVPPMLEKCARAVKAAGIAIPVRAWVRRRSRLNPDPGMVRAACLYSKPLVMASSH